MRLARLLLPLLAVVLLAPTTASAQDSGDPEVSQIDEQIDAVIEELDRLEQELEDIDIATITAEDNLVRLRTELELIADDFAVVGASRVGPNELLETLAIQAYMQGDPVLESVVTELAAGGSRLDSVRDRSIFGAVLDEAALQMEEADRREAALQERRDTTVAAIAEAEDLLVELDADLDDAIERRETAIGELDTLEEQRALALVSPLTGLPTTIDNQRPALAIKIDNVANARPQTGINQADVVIEEMVEGNLTRLIAIFHSEESNPVGPIRSVRTSDVVILDNMNSPLFANSGANQGVMSALAASSLIDVGALSNPGGFYREGSRPAPHNLYSNTADLRAADGGRAGAPPDMFEFRGVEAEWSDDAEAATGVSIAFGRATIRFDWDAATGGWRRSQNGTPHADAAGVVATPTNVIVAVTGYGTSAFDANSPEAQAVGSGEALVFSDGQLVRGTWVREESTAVTRYFDRNGDPIRLLPGKTWIELAPPGSVSVDQP